MTDATAPVASADFGLASRGDQRADSQRSALAASRTPRPPSTTTARST
jgi:hypothetical protein